MNLSTGRVLIIVALIVAGLAVLANGFADEGTTAGASPTPAPTSDASPTHTGSQPPATSEPPSPTPSPNTRGVLFMALNGTNLPGAGAAAQDLLTTDGYKKVQDAANAPTQDIKKTTIYYRPDDSGQNQSDANYVVDQYFKGAAVRKLNVDIQNIVPDSAAIVVVVGSDWATKITT
jgi:hypothetical protein